MQHTLTSEKLDNQLFRGILRNLVPELPPAAASSLSSVPELRNYGIGDLIISEGEPSTGIVLLISGTVQVVVSKRTSRATREVNLQQIVAPAILGITAAMLGQPSAVSMVALTPTETAFIPHEEFLRVLSQFPQAGLAFF
ncbi:MAG: hypothetical protein DMG61_16905 [Acidobacteria bacterium]|nr:MAG: hypothetical protein DMG61_16905 [Acidobacteriota bacterium]